MWISPKAIAIEPNHPQSDRSPRALAQLMTSSSHHQINSSDNQHPHQQNRGRWGKETPCTTTSARFRTRPTMPGTNASNIFQYLLGSVRNQYSNIFPILTGILLNTPIQYLVESKTIFWPILLRLTAYWDLRLLQRTTTT